MIILVHVRCGGIFYSINREEAKRLPMTATSDGNGTSLWVGVSVP